MRTKFLQKTYIFPYAKVQSGTKLVIYGLGKIGNIYVNQLLATNYAEIKYVVDKDYEHLKGKWDNVDVRSPEMLKNETEAVIVVAVSNPYYQNEIVKKLLLYGISMERIINDICQFYWESDRIGKICHTYCTAEEYNEMVSDSRGVECLQIIEKLLAIKKVRGVKLKRIGRERDGGYVMLDDFLDGNVAYSFGISNEISWDEDIASYGYDVFMYDHTISGLPKENEKLHWFPVGITGNKLDNERLMRLEDVLQENGHTEEKHMILKMDVEGAEWGVLKEISSDILSKFDQLVFEFHDIYNKKKHSLIKSCLEKLNKTHQAIHIHPNNCGSCIWVEGKAYPEAVEVTYVKRGKYLFDDLAKISLPIKEDFPNCSCMPEIELRGWNEFA